MAVIYIHSSLRFYTNGQAEVITTRRTVAEAIEQLLEDNKMLKKQLLDENNELRRFVNLFVNNENIRELDGLQTELTEEDRLMIVPSIAGG